MLISSLRQRFAARTELVFSWSLGRFLHFGLVFVSAFLGTRQRRIRNVGLRPEVRRRDGEISTGEHDLGTLANKYFYLGFEYFCL
jgi:hypothetical protein